MTIGARAHPLTPENIESYLNSTKEKHQGHDYNDILNLIRHDISIAGIARLCGKSRGAVENWVELIKTKEGL